MLLSLDQEEPHLKVIGFHAALLEMASGLLVPLEKKAKQTKTKWSCDKMVIDWVMSGQT